MAYRNNVNGVSANGINNGVIANVMAKWRNQINISSISAMANGVMAA